MNVVVGTRICNAVNVDPTGAPDPKVGQRRCRNPWTIAMLDKVTTYMPRRAPMTPSFWPPFIPPPPGWDRCLPGIP
jgi:hypothetical protein